MSATVYPVPGNYLNDVPAVEHECDDAFCVESGAFTTEQPPDKPPPAEAAIDQDPTEQVGSSDSEE